jgi:hypothetical protein
MQAQILMLKCELGSERMYWADHLFFAVKHILFCMTVESNGASNKIEIFVSLGV